MMQAYETWTSIGRRLTAVMFACLYLVLIGNAPADAAQRRAATFSQLIGVNVHMCYTDSAYINRDRMVDHLRYLGVRHVRDIIPPLIHDAGRWGLDSQKALAADGVKLTLIRNQLPLTNQLAVLREFRKTDRTAWAAIEGYNEIHNWPVVVDGISGIRGAARGQHQLYDAINADPFLQRVPVLDLTGDDVVKDSAFPYGANLTGYADTDNFHAYPQNGFQPVIWINPDVRAGAISGRTARKQITEFGYATMPQAGWLVIGVDERTQAKAAVNAMFDAARSSSQRIFLYELVDQRSDPDATSIEWHFGLFTFDGRPKLAAEAIRQLTFLFRDDGSNAGNFQMSPLRVRAIARDGSTVYSWVSEKSDGTLLLALWREPTFWRRDLGTPIDNLNVAVDVTLGRAMATANVHDPLDGSRKPVSLDGFRLTVPISDYVRIVELTPADQPGTIR